MDDSDEETLEGAADLGTMLREMSIDQITRTQPDVDADEEEDDDFEEDDLEEEESDEEDDEEEDGADGFQLDEQTARGEVAEPDDDLHDRAAESGEAPRILRTRSISPTPISAHFAQNGEARDQRTVEGDPRIETPAVSLAVT